APIKLDDALSGFNHLVFSAGFPLFGKLLLKLLCKGFVSRQAEPERILLEQISQKGGICLGSGGENQKQKNLGSGFHHLKPKKQAGEFTNKKIPIPAVTAPGWGIRENSQKKRKDKALKLHHRV